jgi:hypothetical protein
MSELTKEGQMLKGLPSFVIRYQDDLDFAQRAHLGIRFQQRI